MKKINKLLLISVISPLFLLTGISIYSTDTAIFREIQNSKKMKEVQAIFRAYGDLIDNIERQGEDIVFIIRGRPIYYKNGKMLSEEHLSHYPDYNSFFYYYRKGSLKGPPDPVPFPYNRSNDFLNALLGDTEKEIRDSSTWIGFLGHQVFVHRLCIEPLKKIDMKINEYTEASKEVQEFISSISVIYSMKRRKVAGTDNLSYHSYGLALDLIPKSYTNKQVYWKWSSVFNPDWGNIPLSRRWLPPAEIIDAFEENGFVWGGKWYHFDNVHFEYRPEILYLTGDAFD